MLFRRETADFSPDEAGFEMTTIFVYLALAEFSEHFLPASLASACVSIQGHRHFKNRAGLRFRNEQLIRSLRIDDHIRRPITA